MGFQLGPIGSSTARHFSWGAVRTKVPLISCSAPLVQAELLSPWQGEAPSAGCRVSAMCPSAVCECHLLAEITRQLCLTDKHLCFALNLRRQAGTGAKSTNRIPQCHFNRITLFLMAIFFPPLYLSLSSARLCVNALWRYRVPSRHLENK